MKLTHSRVAWFQLHDVAVATGHSGVSVQAHPAPGGHSAVARLRTSSVLGPRRPVRAHLTVAVPLLRRHSVASRLPGDAVVALPASHLGSSSARHAASSVRRPHRPRRAGLGVARGPLSRRSLAPFLALLAVHARPGVHAGSAAASLVARSPLVPFSPEWTVLEKN